MKRMSAVRFNTCGEHAHASSLNYELTALDLTVRTTLDRFRDFGNNLRYTHGTLASFHTLGEPVITH